MTSSMKVFPARASSDQKTEGIHVKQLREACAIRLIRMRQLTEMLAICRSSLYEKMNPKSPRFDPSFPRPIKLGKSTIAFELSAIEQWIQQRIAQSQLSSD